MVKYTYVGDFLRGHGLDTSAFEATQSDPAQPGGLKAVCQDAGCGGFSPANGVFFWRAIAYSCWMAAFWGSFMIFHVFFDGC